MNGANGFRSSYVWLDANLRHKTYLSIERDFSMNSHSRKDIKPGQTVDIVLKEDQRTGKRTRGIVQNILTNSPHHPHGIKVRLTTGEIGRVQAIIASNTGTEDKGEASA